MKKLFCMLIAVLILGMTVSVMAAAEPQTTINDNLVTWYDFEGDAANALKDKATKGTKADNLTKVGDAVKLENGTAYIPSTLDNYLYADASADFNNVSDMTIYMKVQYSHVPDTTHTDFADLVSYPGLYRIYKLKESTSTAGGVLEATAFQTSGDKNVVRIRPQSSKSVILKDNEYFYLAVTTKIDVAAKKGTAVVYISNDGKNYTATEMTLNFADQIYTNLQTTISQQAAKFVLGKLLPTTSPVPERWINYTYDDFRVYNKALTAEELSMIKPNSLELNTPVATTEPTTSATTERTTSPTTAATTTEATTTAATTTEATTTSAEKSGCGSSISIGVLAMAGICTSAVALKKKKR